MSLSLKCSELMPEKVLCEWDRELGVSYVLYWGIESLVFSKTVGEVGSHLIKVDGGYIWQFKLETDLDESDAFLVPVHGVTRRVDEIVSRGIGFPYDYRLGKTHVSEGIGLLQESIYQLLFTNYGERIFRADFGVNLQKDIFENLHEAAPLVQKLVTDAIRSDRRVKNVEVETYPIEEDTSNLTIKVNIESRDSQTTTFQAKYPGVMG